MVVFTGYIFPVTEYMSSLHSCSNFVVIEILEYDEFQVKWFGVALKNRGLESVSWLVRSVKLELPCQILTRHVF